MSDHSTHSTGSAAEHSAIEQLRDIYCGRHSYGDTIEWLENVDAQMKELCDRIGLDFVPVAGEDLRRNYDLGEDDGTLNLVLTHETVIADHVAVDGIVERTFCNGTDEFLQLLK